MTSPKHNRTACFMLVSKVPVWEKDWGEQSPEVESNTGPAGADLDPNSGPVTGQCSEVWTLRTTMKCNRQKEVSWKIALANNSNLNRTWNNNIQQLRKIRLHFIPHGFFLWTGRQCTKGVPYRKVQYRKGYMENVHYTSVFKRPMQNIFKGTWWLHDG